MARVIADLHPALQGKIEELKFRCKQAGLPIKITDCVRNAEEQADCVRRKASTLQYPYSMHNWGVAVDFCRDAKGLEYNNDDRFFDMVGSIGESIGLMWGGSWQSPVDKPHFQLSTWGKGTQTLRTLYGTPEKFRSVWSGVPLPTQNNIKEGKDVVIKTVKRGDKGNAVKMIQAVIGSKVDGIFGLDTFDKVKAYQWKEGLDADGIVGVKTWTVMFR